MLWLIIPQLVDCVRLLLAQIPVALERAAEWLVQTGIADELVARLTEWAEGFDWQGRLEGIISAVLGGATDVVGVVAGVVTTAVSGIATAFISIIFAVYVLLAGRSSRGSSTASCGAISAKGCAGRYATSSASLTTASTASSSGSVPRP